MNYISRYIYQLMNCLFFPENAQIKFPIYCENFAFGQVIPIEGDFTVNDEPQKTFEEILPEIVISK